MLIQITVLLAGAFLLGLIKPGRRLLLLAASALAVFWLQPATQPANLAFWLPAATLLASGVAWYITAAPEARGWKRNGPALLVLAGVILLVDLDRYLDPAYVFTVFSPRPPVLLAVLAGLGLLFLLISVSRKWQRVWLALALAALLLAFVLVKAPALLDALYARLAAPLSGPDQALLPALRWLGFSYIAFRLIHTIRDRQSGRLPALALDEYVTYVVFFPTLNAGPIDRAERFVPELRQAPALTQEDWVFVIRRVSFGLFKKFVLADTLAVFALNDSLARQVHSPGWMWLAVYAYAFQIYFDFSGYTDLAIGMGRLLGFHLPENFSAPYLKPDIAQFWNNWHITLTHWFRAYYFNPLARSLRRARLPAWLGLALAQFSTMLLIGLWHGFGWGYLLWGAWHGVGLFVHNRWSEAIRSREQAAPPSVLRHKLLVLAGVLLTFHFVALGWVFFALSTPELAWRVLRVLFGVAS
jgi:D-alanyl-lipoteichoic acid acyltransferase DltB (MBOAT superfamily)